MTRLSLLPFGIALFLASLTSCEKPPLPASAASNPEMQAQLRNLSENHLKLEAELNRVSRELEALKIQNARQQPGPAAADTPSIPTDLHRWLTGSWTTYNHTTNPDLKEHFFIDGASLISVSGQWTVNGQLARAKSIAYQVIPIEKGEIEKAIEFVRDDRWKSSSLEPDFSFPPPTHLFKYDIPSGTPNGEGGSSYYIPVRFISSTPDSTPSIRDEIIIGKRRPSRERAIQDYYNDDDDRMRLARNNLEPAVRAADLPSAKPNPVSAPVPAIASTTQPIPSGKSLPWTSNLPSNDPRLAIAVGYISKVATCEGSNLIWEKGPTRSFPGGAIIEELFNVHLEIADTALTDADRQNGLQSQFVVKVSSKTSRFKTSPDTSWSAWNTFPPGAANLTFKFTHTAEGLKVTAHKLNDEYGVRPAKL